MATIGTLIEKIGVQKNLTEKKDGQDSETAQNLKLKLLFYTNLESRFTAEFAKRNPGNENEGL